MSTLDQHLTEHGCGCGLFDCEHPTVHALSDSHGIGFGNCPEAMRFALAAGLRLQRTSRLVHVEQLP